MPDQEPDQSPVVVTSAKDATGPSAAAFDPSPRRLTLLAPAAGTLSGLAAWLAWEAVSGSFTPGVRWSGSWAATRRSSRLRANCAGIRGGAVAAAILGEAMGLGLGLAGGLARRMARAGLAAGLVGAVLGALGGLGASWGLLPVFYRNESPISGDLLLPLLTQGGVWCVLGAAGGIALGLGLGSPGLALRAGLGGLLGALGATIYEAVGASAFPHDETDQPVSKTWVTRLALRMLVALLAAAGAALACKHPAGRSGRPKTVAEAVEISRIRRPVTGPPARPRRNGGCRRIAVRIRLASMHPPRNKGSIYEASSNHAASLVEGDPHVPGHHLRHDLAHPCGGPSSRYHARLPGDRQRDLYP